MEDSFNSDMPFRDYAMTTLPQPIGTSYRAHGLNVRAKEKGCGGGRGQLFGFSSSAEERPRTGAYDNLDQKKKALRDTWIAREAEADE